MQIYKAKLSIVVCRFLVKLKMKVFLFLEILQVSLIFLLNHNYSNELITF